MKNKKHKKIYIILSIPVILIIICLVLFMFTIKSVEVEGNNRYSDDEVKNFILKDKYDNHTLYFFLKSKFSDNTKIAYVESYNVDLISLNSIRISVNEKYLVGCIEYMGTFMSFDKNGIISESSKTQLEGVPIVSGLDFNYVLINEKLPVEDPEVFDLLLNFTQLLRKFQILVDKIYLTSSQEILIYLGDVKIELGTKENLNEKLIDLKDIQDLIKDKSGTMDMKTYDENKVGYTFKISNGE